MKELWDIAIQPHNLPLTCVVGVFMLYWLICILGVFGIDSLDLDFDGDLDGDINHSGSSPMVAILKFVNATDVPLMAVLSILSIFMWVMTMMGNYYLNPDLNDIWIFAIFAGSFVVGIVLTKFATAPLVPIFRKMKELEKAEPAVGGVGIVISKSVDEKYGQVEQKRKEGAPAILNCRISGGDAIPRGSEVSVVSYDKDSGIYLVRKI